MSKLDVVSQEGQEAAVNDHDREGAGFVGGKKNTSPKTIKRDHSGCPSRRNNRR